MRGNGAWQLWYFYTVRGLGDAHALGTWERGDTTIIIFNQCCCPAPTHSVAPTSCTSSFVSFFDPVTVESWLLVFQQGAASLPERVGHAMMQGAYESEGGPGQPFGRGCVTQSAG